MQILVLIQKEKQKSVSPERWSIDGVSKETTQSKVRTFISVTRAQANITRSHSIPRTHRRAQHERVLRTKPRKHEIMRMPTLDAREKQNASEDTIHFGLPRKDYLQRMDTREEKVDRSTFLQPPPQHVLDHITACSLPLHPFSAERIVSSYCLSELLTNVTNGAAVLPAYRVSVHAL